MQERFLKKTLTGIIPPLVTPLADENHFVLVQAYNLVEETKPEMPVEAAKKTVSQPQEVSEEKVISGSNEINEQP